MLGFIFGFNARLGRLAYFLYSLVFCIVIGVVVVAGAYIAYRNGLLKPDGFSPGAISPLSLIPILLISLLVIWGAVCLMSMRIRDIGWNPAYVIAIYLLVIGVDTYISLKMPDLAFQQGRSGTVFGAALQFVFTLTLWFWPGGAYDAAPPDMAERLPPRREPPPPSEMRPVRTVPSVHDVRPIRKSFGRLGQ
jgi:uncharacterized membrane protein YhaH (DUF805 family)